MNKEELLKLRCCPHCNGESGYFRAVRYVGYYEDTKDWNHKIDNTHMWDGARETWLSKFIKCKDCGKIICRADDGTSAKKGKK